MSDYDIGYGIYHVVVIAQCPMYLFTKAICVLDAAGCPRLPVDGSVVKAKTHLPEMLGFRG